MRASTASNPVSSSSSSFCLEYLVSPTAPVASGALCGSSASSLTSSSPTSYSLCSSCLSGSLSASDSWSSTSLLARSYLSRPDWLRAAISDSSSFSEVSVAATSR